MATKFADPAELPDGFLYRENFLSEDEEAELLRIFRGLEFEPYDYHGYIGKRRIVRYGTNYDLNTRQASETTGEIPEFLLPIRERAADVAGIVLDEMVQAMVSEYSVASGCAAVRDDRGNIPWKCVPHAAEALQGCGQDHFGEAGAAINLRDARSSAIELRAQHSGGDGVALFHYVSDIG